MKYAYSNFPSHALQTIVIIRRGPLAGPDGVVPSAPDPRATTSSPAPVGKTKSGTAPTKKKGGLFKSEFFASAVSQGLSMGLEAAGVPVPTEFVEFAVGAVLPSNKK